MAHEGLLFAFDERHILENIGNWTKVDDKKIETIVHFRSPRMSQFTSMWKQATIRIKPQHGYSFRKWLCDDEYVDFMISRLLGGDSNPLESVQKLVDRGYLTHLIDMEGVAKAEKDISHVIACEILQVPCTNGWVDGVETDIISANQRKGSSYLTNSQLQEMEELFRIRDCSYQEQLINHERLVILHQDALWKNCTSDDKSQYDRMRNTKVMLEALRDIVVCDAGEVSHPSGELGALHNDHADEETIQLPVQHEHIDETNMQLATDELAAETAMQKSFGKLAGLEWLLLLTLLAVRKWALRRK